MRSKKIVLVALVLLFVGGASAGIWVLLVHEPDFYARCAIPFGRERQRQAGEFMSEFGMLVDHIQHESREWDAQFYEKAINSYFEESFVPSGVAKRVLPEGVSHPRVAITPNNIRLAFRYGQGVISTVVSIDLRVWLAPKERNVVALELQGLHAGSLPISAQSLQEQVTEVARPNNIDVTWYRHEGNPVALLRFQADKPRPTVLLKEIRLRAGCLSIKGTASEPPMLGMLPFGEFHSGGE
jgi:hypothetical protein